MTDASYKNETLRLQFPGWEAAMTGRASFAAARTSITRVNVLDGWTSEILGYRRGIAISGYLKLGTFTHPSGVTRLVAMRRGNPVLRVGLRGRASGDEFDELLISTPDAAAIAHALGVTVYR